MEQQGYKKLPEPPQQPLRGREHELPLIGHSDWRRELRKTILSRVVPRLSEIGKGGDAGAAADPPVLVSPDQVVAFAELALTASVPSLIKYVDILRSDGMAIEAVLLQLLAPAARHLGDLWLEDKLSFLDVTAGLGRLQGIMRALGPDLEGDQTGIIHGKKVLLAPVWGEQHIFGLSVVAAFFRRAGWDVTFEPRIAFEELLILVRAERFTTIGLSVANDRFAEALPRQIKALRSASLNQGVTILAGGAAFSIDPELQKHIGADAVASDATEAVQMAEALSGQTAPTAPIRGQV